MSTERAARAQRSDARRNRARVLEVAAEVFATEGLSVPVHEIARRAGVGTGTVSRHFPTKESLFVAILKQRMEQLTQVADRLAATESPGNAFFDYFTTLIREGAANRGLSDALAGSGFDVESAAASGGHDVSGRLRQLLGRAQQAGAIRVDVDYPDVKVLMTACLARGDDPAALDRMVSVVCAGIRADPAGPPYDEAGAQDASGSAGRAEPT